MPNAFYVFEVQDDLVFLDPFESQHLKTVRVKPGDEVTCIDGSGGIYRVIMDSIEKKGSRGKVISRTLVKRDKKFITVSVAATKWPRLRLVIEKATELGVNEIEIFESLRSVARVDKEKTDRYKAVVREAAKQSINPFFPIINIHKGLPHYEPSMLNILLDFNGKKMFYFRDKINSTEAIRLLIGPEGGFTEEEIETFRDSGILVSLGRRVLRVETAVTVSLGLLNSIIERI